jgi:hypothetical protein
MIYEPGTESVRVLLDEGEFLDESEGERCCGGYIQGVSRHVDSCSSHPPPRKLYSLQSFIRLSLCRSSLRRC